MVSHPYSACPSPLACPEIYVIDFDQLLGFVFKSNYPQARVPIMRP